MRICVRAPTRDSVKRPSRKHVPGTARRTYGAPRVAKQPSRARPGTQPMEDRSSVHRCSVRKCPSVLAKTTITRRRQPSSILLVCARIAMLKRTALALLLALTATLPAQAQDKTVTVYAAVSMKNALDDIDAAFTKTTGVKVVISLSAS